MESSCAARGHLSIIKGHYEIVGHMFEGETKNTIENKGKSNKEGKGWHVQDKHSGMQRILGISKVSKECFTWTIMGYKYRSRST